MTRKLKRINFINRNRPFGSIKKPLPPGSGYGESSGGDGSFGAEKNCQVVEITHIELSFINAPNGYAGATTPSVRVGKLKGTFEEIQDCTADSTYTCPDSPNPLDIDQQSTEITIKVTGSADKEVKKCEDCEEVENPTTLVWKSGGLPVYEALRNFVKKICDPKTSGDGDTIEIIGDFVCLKDRWKGCEKKGGFFGGAKKCDEKKITILGTSEDNEDQIEDDAETYEDYDDIDYDTISGALGESEVTKPPKAGEDEGESYDPKRWQDVAIPRDKFCAAFNDKVAECLDPVTADAAARFAKCWDELMNPSWDELLSLAGDDGPTALKKILGWFEECICD